MLSVIRLSVVNHRVAMLNVVAPSTIFDSVLTEEEHKGQGLCIFTAPIK